MWDETVRLGPAEHARFVLHKGDDRVADTLLPAQQLVGRLGAHIAPERRSLTARIGQPVNQRVQVTNAGTLTWKAQGRRFGGQVTLGLKVCDQRGDVLREDLGRTALPHDVRPGESVQLEIAVAGVMPAGSYTLRYDMVVEGVTWFEFQGSQCADGVLDVTG
jgi:hypothetical protein